MSLEAYFPESLGKKVKVREKKFEDLIEITKKELARFDGMLKHNPFQATVKAFLRAEEGFSSASLEFSGLNFEEYIEKLLDKGFGADDLNEFRYIVNLYDEMDKRVGEKGFSIDVLNEFQSSLLDNRTSRKHIQEQLIRKRQFWLHDAVKEKNGFDMRLYAYPDPETMNNLMENLDDYIRKSKNDPLITSAVVYGQLVMIHPWAYANGRTTGALIPFLFNSLGLTRERSFYLSSAFCREKEKYFSKIVQLFQDREWDKWVEYFLQKVYAQVISGQKKIDHLINYCRDLKATVLKNSFTKEALFYVDKMLKRPVFKVTEVEREFQLRYGALFPYIYFMLDAGFLIQDNRKRNINYVFREVFALMDL